MLDADFARVVKAEAKRGLACLDQSAKRGASFSACVAAPNAKVESAKAKTLKHAARDCADSPDIGFTSPVKLNDSAQVAVRGVFEDLYGGVGSDIDGNVASWTATPEVAKCQRAVARSAQRCLVAQIAEFNRCKRTSVKAGARRSSDLDECTRANVQGRVLKACGIDFANNVVPRACEKFGVDLVRWLPTCAEPTSPLVAQCLDARLACRACEARVGSDRLSAFCGTCPYQLTVAEYDGSDANPGTALAPLRTLTRAASLAQPGTRIRVMPGTYTAATGEHFPIAIPAGVTVIGNASGDIIPYGAPRTVRGGGPLPDPNDGNATLVLGQGSRLAGFSISGEGADPGFSVDARNVDVSVDHCELIGGLGIRAGGTGRVLVARNIVESSAGGVLAEIEGGELWVEESVFQTGGVQATLAVRGVGDAVRIRDNEFIGSVAAISLRSESAKVVGNRFTSLYPRNEPAVIVGGVATLRDNEFFEPNGAILIDDPDATVDLGRLDDPGGNRFNADYAAVQLEVDRTISAEGNVWYHSPPTCGSDIITNAGSVRWGSAPAERCP